MAIESFRHKGLQELFINGKSKRINQNHRNKLIELMDILDAATATKDLEGVNDFHPLRGNRKGEYSMHVSGNWCLTFEFEDGEARNLDYEDYH